MEKQMNGDPYHKLYTKTYSKMDRRPKYETLSNNSPRGKHKGKSLQPSSDQRLLRTQNQWNINFLKVTN